MPIQTALLAMALLISGVGSSAAQGWNPLETREDAWRRQQALDYQHQRANPLSVNPRREPLGDNRVSPPSGFNSFGQPQWGGGQPQPFGSAPGRSSDPWRR